MICIISGTNRPGNLSKIVATDYQNILTEKGFQTELIDLQELPADLASPGLYQNRPQSFDAFQNKINAANRFIFIVPEYNGSIPGILKLFLDACDYPGEWRGKKAAVLGLSAGIGGNMKGLGHLSDILNYLGVQVCPARVHLAKIREKVSDQGLANEREIISLNEQTREFLDL